MGDYEWELYSEAAQRVEDLGAGLAFLGIQPGEKIGLMAKNCAEWMIADLAIARQRLISVPVYDVYGPEECEFIIRHSDAVAVLCSEDKLPFIRQVQARVPTLRHVIVIDCVGPRTAPWHNARLGPAFSGATASFSEVESLGAAHPSPAIPCTPDDHFTYVYTSGTTGTPKGAILTHRAILAGCYMLSDRYLPRPADLSQDCMISYLPLAHIFERELEHLHILLGCRLGYYSGDIGRLSADINALKPTILAGVPRVFSKTYTKLVAGIRESWFFVRWLFALFYRIKRRAMLRGKLSPLADRVVFQKLRDRLGGRLRLVYSGSAPLQPHIAEFLSVCMCASLVEGYGLTETSACVTCLSQGDYSFGTVGIPYHYSEVKLVDLPDMDYLTTDRPHPRGEIYCRGPQCFVGYYKDPAKSAEVLTPDGWVRTGDVGQWIPGPFGPTLKIIDRVKNVFKLSRGEFICAERIESVYKESEYVSQIMVHGERTAPSIIAVVVPEFGRLGEWASSHGLASIAQDPAALSSHPAVRRLLLDACHRVADSSSVLRPFERVADICVADQEWSVENKLLTPSFKLKREAIRRHYAVQLRAMLPAEEDPGVHITPPFREPEASSTTS
eukprot:gnl/Trimastix_PCT/687.p1 GENE.gnl/Trimastix_PCT/687~~gnl/Trimastix_PCT/687.p1  ORF type:complete len:614 (+),score=148.89 gnl/Trimastix_PCT/687:342-2183(+)